MKPEAGLPAFSSLRRKPHKPLFKVFLVLTNWKEQTQGTVLPVAGLQAGVCQAELAKLVRIFTPIGRCLRFMAKAVMPGTAHEGR